MNSLQTALIPVPSAPRVPRPRPWMGLATCLTATAIVAAAVLPQRRRLGLEHLPPLHPHAPQLWRVAEAAPAIQIHLAAVTVALAVGVVLLRGVKGSALHRTLGWTWVLAMATAAASSLFIHQLNPGHLSFIHLLSGWTIISLPMAVAFARRHKVQPHARAMTGLFSGGLILAGLFAFVPGRLMWNLFFG